MSHKCFPIISFIIVLASIYYSISSQTTPTPNNPSSSISDFSTEKALNHLKEITKIPHYVGSPGHQSVQKYIVKQLRKLGLETEIQHQVAINKKSYNSANTQNILARIKGTKSGNALLLLTHYDSAPHSSLGASDAGSGVVTILEGIRVFLAETKLPKNDIIILFSDAEEIGLLGATAFVKHHRWAKDVALVLNFEARGSGGPSYMLMETNGGNKNLIQNFSKANPVRPVANSLMYSLYKKLPNDTDLTVFRQDGDIEGFNFAFIDDHFDYHTAQDSYERLDRTSLQHQAAYLVPLLQYFSNSDLTNLRSDGDYVYLNMPSAGMLYYPYSWVVPVLILVILIFAGLIIYGHIKQKITLKNALVGFIPFTLSLLISGFLSFYLWKLLLIIHQSYNDIQHGFTYNGHFYIAAIAALSLAISFYIYNYFIKKLKIADLIIAPVFFWILINILIAVYLKGAGFFIAAPIFGLASMAILFFFKNHRQRNTIFIALLAVPVLMIFTPMVSMFPIGLGLKNLVISSTLIVLLFGLLIPLFSDSYLNKLLGLVFFLLALTMLSIASFESGYDEENRKPNSVIYILDSDKNLAYWASHDTQTDAFTKQFLGDTPATGSFDKNASINKYNSKYKLHKRTEVLNITKPVVDVISDTTNMKERKVHLSISSLRDANRFTLISNSQIHYTSLSINGEEISRKDENGFVLVSETGKTLLRYSLSEKNEKLELVFTFPADEVLDLTLYEISYDLLENPLFTIQPRDETMMPTPFIVNDAIIVKKSIIVQ